MCVSMGSTLTEWVQLLPQPFHVDIRVHILQFLKEDVCQQLLKEHPHLNTGLGLQHQSFLF